MIVIVGNKAFDSKLEPIKILFNEDEFENCLFQLEHTKTILSFPEESILLEQDN